MTIHEVDWRYSSIKEILNAVTAALDKIQKEVLPEDVDEALEQLESFLGIAFVAAQTYIAGATGDCRRIVKDANEIAILTKATPIPKPEPKDLRNDFGYMISGHGITKIELCYQIADYFKHEWPNWSHRPGPQNEWRRVLSARIDGTDEAITYPCQETAKILLGGSSYDFEPLLSILTEWRKKVIADCKKRAQQIIRPEGE